jgi:hypothetical protein|tara:strand:- start:996 stop:1277 length:282 start_codon:yes stop_codon:yes gene_type:complete
MSSNKNPFGICDTCGFRYRLRELKKDTAGNLVCPTDFDGRFDVIDHPQNKTANLRDDETVRNPRPEPLNAGRNIEWQNANTNWNETDQEWQRI